MSIFPGSTSVPSFGNGILDFKVCPSPMAEAPATLKALPGAGDRDVLGQILLLAPMLVALPG